MQGAAPGLAYIVAGCWGICSMAWAGSVLSENKGLPAQGHLTLPGTLPATAYSSSGAESVVSREDSPLGPEAVSSVTALGRCPSGGKRGEALDTDTGRGQIEYSAHCFSQALGTSQLKAENRGKEYPRGP